MCGTKLYFNLLIPLDDAKEALASIAVPTYEYKTGELWLLCGQKRYGLEDSKKIEFKRGYDNVHLTVNIPQGSVKLLCMRYDVNTMSFSHKCAIILFRWKL